MIEIPVRLIIICLFGCVCLLSTTPITHAFVDLSELNTIIEQFQDIFIDLGGRELLERLEQGESVDRQDFVDLDAFFGIPCLLSTIRFNKLAKQAASKKCYGEVNVCLTNQDGFKNCSQDEMIQFTDKLDASGNEFRYLNDESSMSPNLHGVFWLNYPLIGSSINTFAKTRDGGELSTGTFESDKEDISYRLRVAGDRNWAFEMESGSYEGTDASDFIYELRVTQGTDENPERITVFLSFILPFNPIFRFHLRECFHWCRLNIA
jgi:hypothetical protein